MLKNIPACILLFIAYQTSYNILLLHTLPFINEILPLVTKSWGPFRASVILSHQLKSTTKQPMYETVIIYFLTLSDSNFPDFTTSATVDRIRIKRVGLYFGCGDCGECDSHAVLEKNISLR